MKWSVFDTLVDQPLLQQADVIRVNRQGRWDVLKGESLLTVVFLQDRATGTIQRGVRSSGSGSGVRSWTGIFS